MVGACAGRWQLVFCGKPNSSNLGPEQTQQISGSERHLRDRGGGSQRQDPRSDPDRSGIACAVGDFGSMVWVWFPGQLHRGRWSASSSERLCLSSVRVRQRAAFGDIGQESDIVCESDATKLVRHFLDLAAGPAWVEGVE